MTVHGDVHGDGYMPAQSASAVGICVLVFFLQRGAGVDAEGLSVCAHYSMRNTYRKERESVVRRQSSVWTAVLRAG